ncbi:MAG: hypothetical protein QMB65_00600 [Vicingaceae bacterium]|jgi:hypothetical protein
MKKFALIPLLTICTILLTFYSCKKDEDTITPVIEETTPITNTPTSSTSNLSDFFNQNITDNTQSFTVDASTWSSFTGSKGTYAYIPANSFKDNSGNIVSGNISIELIEIQTKADMIWMNKTTTSNGQLLVSGGELSIKAFQNGEQLTLSQNGYVSIQMPTNNPTNMSLFSGTEDAIGNVNWDSTGTTVPVDTSGGFNFTIQSGTFSNDSLGWINCDYFYNQSNLTTLSVIPPTNHDGTNTSIYLFFNNIYSVAPAAWNSNSSNFQSYLNSLPIGEQITIVAVSDINGQMYSSFTPITLTANHSETITLSSTTALAFQADLDNL